MATNLKKYFDAANQAEARVQEVAARVDKLFDENKVEEAQKLRPELDAAKKEAKAAHELYLSMAVANTNDGADPGHRFVPTGGDPEPKAVKDLRASAEYTGQFWTAFKSGVSPKSIKAGMHSAAPFGLLMDALSETGGSPAGSEGGFLNPVDFDNMIHELQRLAVDLAPYTNTVEVTTLSGWRAVEHAKAAAPFGLLAERPTPPATETLSEMESPLFDRIPFSLLDYGGYLPVSNDLLNDTPANIMTYLARWCGRKVSLTNTSLTLAILNAISPTNVSDYKTLFQAMKTALNKTLDPAISANAAIFCNQTGLDLMDQLLDGDGRPMLQPDPTSSTKLTFKGRPIVTVPTSQQANLSGTTYTPILIGDISEHVTFFRRAAGELASTMIGGDAWRSNSTEIRYIMRADPEEIDASATVLLKVTLP